MWFWWFALVCDVLIPLVMIVFGRVMWKHCPANINSWIGYRTQRSMKNRDTWQFAHEFCGRLWWKYGWIMLLPSVVATLFVYGAGEDPIGVVMLITMGLQSAILVYPIWQTERALKNRFDDNGVKR